MARTGGGQTGYQQALEAFDRAQSTSGVLTATGRASIQYGRASALRNLGRTQEADAASAEARRLQGS